MKKKIFISYCHQERALVQDLVSKLKQFEKEGLAEIWFDKDISPGSEWENVIDNKINESDIILCCISASFLESRSCRREVDIGCKLKKEKKLS